ncbi:hypothetical protein M8J75_013171 [Diaphorina citri]|nr:hypothetical protein M8J75_013171 [Diaphorina citri]
MGGTDRLDQNVSCYRSNIRSKKWWWPLFLWGIDVSIQNAWLLHRKSCKSTNVPTLDLLDFRRAIAQVLMTKNATPRIRSGVVRSVVSGRVSSDARTNNSALEHILVQQQKRTRCGQCHSHTITKCQKCGIAIHKKCFAEFHSS